MDWKRQYTYTSSGDHGIRNVLTSCGTELTISGSSDPQWNDTFCVVAAPTSTTLKVAKFRSTDLAIDATTNTKVTAASHSFTSGDVGKYVNVYSGTGFTQGAYQISSVSSGAAILTTSPGTAGSTGGQWFFSPYPATADKTDGTITWDDTTTIGIGTLSEKGSIIKTSNDQCVHRGHDFTVSGRQHGRRVLVEHHVLQQSLAG